MKNQSSVNRNQAEAFKIVHTFHTRFVRQWIIVSSELRIGITITTLPFRTTSTRVRYVWLHRYCRRSYTSLTLFQWRVPRQYDFAYHCTGIHKGAGISLFGFLLKKWACTLINPWPSSKHLARKWMPSSEKTMKVTTNIHAMNYFSCQRYLRKHSWHWRWKNSVQWAATKCSFTKWNVVGSKRTLLRRPKEGTCFKWYFNFRTSHFHMPEHERLLRFVLIKCFRGLKVQFNVMDKLRKMQQIFLNNQIT